MKLIPNAAQWHRLWSMRFALAATMFSTAAGAWALMPPDWQPHIAEWGKWLLAGIGVLLPALAGASRVIEQTALREPPAADDTDKAGA